jgi:TAT (twin-arginine translocation) pathway signal sequence/FecR protein
MVVDHEAEGSCSVHRREFLGASAALGAALLLPGVARSAGVRLLEGSVNVNGKPATRATRVRPGDVIETGPDGKLVFVVGQNAFLLRERSNLKLANPVSGRKGAPTGIRLEAGALVAVFGKGRRQIETATATATIRGTGVYLEASADQTYFCTCYGEVELRDKTGAERKLVIAGYHTPNMIYARAVDGRMLTAASVKDHTDAELIMLDGLVGRTSPLLGRRQADAAKSEPVQPESPRVQTPERAVEKKARKKQSTKPQPSPTEFESQPQAAAPIPAPVPEPVSAPEPPPPEQELRLPPARLE